MTSTAAGDENSVCDFKVFLFFVPISHSRYFYVHNTFDKPKKKKIDDDFFS